MTYTIPYKTCPMLSGVCFSEWPCQQQKCPFWMIETGCPGCGLSPMIEGLRQQILKSVDNEIAAEYEKKPMSLIETNSKGGAE